MSTAVLEPETITLEKGESAIAIEHSVDDGLYGMQDKFGLPYTTVDDKGNTIVSVVEKITTDWNNPENIKSKLNIRLFKNTPVAIELKRATHVDDIVNPSLERSLEWNKEQDPNMNELYRTVLRDSRDGTNSNYVKYSAYEDIGTTTTASASILYPHIKTTYTTGSTACYVWENSWNTTTDCTYNHHINYWVGQDNPVKSAIDRIREIIQNRIAPTAIIRRNPLGKTTDVRELRARQTLRRIIGEEAYQRYLCRGFITFKGASGRGYQIFPGHGKTKVWMNGKQIEELCVVLTGDFPTTDSVIMRLMILQDREDKFRNIANVFKPTSISKNTYRIPIEKESLSSIFSNLKKNKDQNLLRMAS